MQTRLKRYAALMLLGCLLLAGCGGGGGGGTSGGETTVIGRVLDSRRQDQPVAGARVEIGGASATTAADGSFTIRGAAVGAAEAVITAPGLGPQTVAFSPPVARGSNGRFELIINIGQIRGRVLAPAGQPAAGARVTVVATGDSVAAGADGTFRLDNVPTGSTELTAVLGTAFASRTVAVQVGVTDVGDLALVNDPNPNPPGAPRTIEGRIALSDGASPAGLVVLLLRNGVEVERTTTAADGSYSFYVPAGIYVVRVSREGYRDAVSQDVPVTNPSTPVRVDLALARL